MAQHDLTLRIAPYLDRHLVFPLLEFLQGKALYPEREIMEGKIELLKRTNMVDFAMDIYKNLNETDEVPADMVARRTEVVGDLRRLEKEARPIIHFLSDPNNVRTLRLDKALNLRFLHEQYQIGPDQIEALFRFAQCQFQCGNYGMSAELLQSYRQLCTSPERGFSALWGRFASNILLQNFEAANDDLSKLKEAMDQQSFVPPLLQLQQRTWLMHWALFVFWNHKNGVNSIIDVFLQEDRYLNAMQTNAPHLLRYLCAAVVINYRRKSVLKDLVKIILQEAYEYSDPITQFLEALYVNYDFDQAQERLEECSEILDNDYFLATARDEFLENARLAIFETYCRIHQCIDIKTMSQKLNMDEDAAEKWIVNLIRNEKLDARVDSRSRTVVMGVVSQSIMDQIIDRTRDLSIKTFRLANEIVGSSRA